MKRALGKPAKSASSSLKGSGAVEEERRFFREELSRVKLSRRLMMELLAFLKRLKDEPGVEKVHSFGMRVYGAPSVAET